MSGGGRIFDRVISEPSHVAATRAAYDAVAADYAEMLEGALAAAPVDRAVLGVFAELVVAGGGGPVGDVGCGPGRITGHLAGLGLDAFGVDLSPRMVAEAGRRHPALRFEVGSVLGLDLPDGRLAGAVAWYSLIHLPPDHHPAAVAELARVLAPAGHLLLAFQVGEDQRVRLDRPYGHDVELDAFRLSLERMVGLLADAGLDLRTRVVREPEGREKNQQAYLLARRSG